MDGLNINRQQQQHESTQFHIVHMLTTLMDYITSSIPTGSTGFSPCWFPDSPVVIFILILITCHLLLV